MFDELPAGWQIHNMSEAHIPRVREVEIQAYPFPWSEGIFKDCIAGGYLCKVIENPEQDVMAYAVVSVAVGESHVLNICVSGAHRGKGIARWLLRYMLEEARVYEAKLALLEVRVSNAAAIRLYETFGFAEIGRRKNYYPDHDGREDAIVMSLLLDDSLSFKTHKRSD